MNPHSYSPLPGFTWIAGRDDGYGEWSHAGAVGALSTGGPWVAMLPEELQPVPGSEDGKAHAKNCQEGMLQDRR